MSRQFNGYLTVKEAARYLGVSPATLRNWDRAGKLTPCRHPVNDYRLYRKEDLERILYVKPRPWTGRPRVSDRWATRRTRAENDDSRCAERG